MKNEEFINFANIYSEVWEKCDWDVIEQLEQDYPEFVKKYTEMCEDGEEWPDSDSWLWVHSAELKDEKHRPN